MTGDCGHGWGYHSHGRSGPFDKCEEINRSRTIGYCRRCGERSEFDTRPAQPEPAPEVDGNITQMELEAIGDRSSYDDELRQTLRILEIPRLAIAEQFPLSRRKVVELVESVLGLRAELVRQRAAYAAERAGREAAEAALLDCQRYVLDNGIDVARAKIAGRVSEVLRK